MCTTFNKKQTNIIFHLNLKKHTFAFIDGNIDLHFTRFHADVRNDTKSPYTFQVHRLSPWFGLGQSTQSSYFKNVSHS